eukprot:6176761-Pleurochrysis_carterae.AAC.1
MGWAKRLAFILHPECVGPPHTRPLLPHPPFQTLSDVSSSPASNSHPTSNTHFNRTSAEVQLSPPPLSLTRSRFCSRSCSRSLSRCRCRPRSRPRSRSHSL